MSDKWRLGHKANWSTMVDPDCNFEQGVFGQIAGAFLPPCKTALSRTLAPKQGTLMAMHPKPLPARD